MTSFWRTAPARPVRKLKEVAARGGRRELRSTRRPVRRSRRSDRGRRSRGRSGARGRAPIDGLAAQVSNCARHRMLHDPGSLRPFPYHPRNVWRAQAVKAPIVDGSGSRPGLWGGVARLLPCASVRHRAASPRHHQRHADRRDADQRRRDGGGLRPVRHRGADLARDRRVLLARPLQPVPGVRRLEDDRACPTRPGPGRRGSSRSSGSARCSSSERTGPLPLAAPRSYSRASRHPRVFLQGVACKVFFVRFSRSSPSRGRSPRRRHRQHHRRHRRPRFAARARAGARPVRGRDRSHPESVGLCRLLPAVAVARLRRAVHQQPPDPHRRPHLLRGFRRAADQLLLQDAGRAGDQGRPPGRRGASSGPNPPKAGSNYDFAIVPLAEPIDGVEPFPGRRRTSR